jgi:hypothetical protein
MHFAAGGAEIDLAIRQRRISNVQVRVQAKEVVEVGVDKPADLHLLV